MAFVTQVPESQAAPELLALYQQIREDFGFLPEFFQAQGSAPEILSKQWDLLTTLMRDGALPRPIKEKILLVVSGMNSSAYCIAAHMDVLQRFKVEKSVARKLAAHYASAPVEPKEMVLFRLADKLTRDPAGVQKADIDSVLEAGWSEAALIEAVLTIAWANFINRLAFGLGVVADY